MLQTAPSRTPADLYPAAGMYTVNLTVTGPGGSDDEVKVEYITVTTAPVPAPVADFRQTRSAVLNR